MILIDGSGAVLGRLASFVAKQALKGEEINIVNCDQVIITGNKKDVEKEFKEKRSKVGSVQKGPKHHQSSEKIVKRTIRGMLPEHRFGRGREAFKKIKCFTKTPQEFQGKEMISMKEKRTKFVQVKHVSKK